MLMIRGSLGTTLVCQCIYVKKCSITLLDPLGKNRSLGSFPYPEEREKTHT